MADMGGGGSMGAGGAGGYLGAVGGLLGGISDRRAAKGANKFSGRRTQHALSELTPEAMQAMISKFFTQFYGQLNPAMQGALSRIGTQAGRSGLTGAGVTKQLSAGVPGQFANMAMGQAIGPSVDIAKQRANTWMGQDYMPMGNWAGILSKAIQGFGGQYSGPKY